MIAAGRNLRLIQRLGSLTYDIDLEAARAAGMPVAAWPVETAIMVAEHMLTQMLVLAKRLGDVSAVANAAGDWGRPSLRTDEDTFAYDWSRRSGVRPLYEQTVGILGFGEIGAELARRLRGFCPSTRALPQEVAAAGARRAGAGHHLRAPGSNCVAESDYLCACCCPTIQKPTCCSTPGSCPG